MFGIFNKDSRKGFSLVELMIVIGIIAVLSAVVLGSIGSSRAKARDARRKSDLVNIQVALRIYREENGSYPVTPGVWWGLSDNGGNRTVSGVNAYVPGLTPTYISVLPADPKGVTSGWSGYLYTSNGTNYKFLSHFDGPESFPSVGQPFYDPVRPTTAWMVCSGEPACSNW
jgi:prepilin-type N-terminal cleavage/methylation domain-containing protein